MAAEKAAFAPSVVTVQRATGQVHIFARQLLGQVGLAGCALPKASSGAPIWPTGDVGSLSHDSRIAVATIGLRRDFSALGIDIKTADPLLSKLLKLVATPQ